MNPNIDSDSAEEAKAHEGHRVMTAERVPGNDHYYEKNGLRSYGDGENHDEEPPVSPSMKASVEVYSQHDSR
jgi:hypothetical protein